MFGWILNKIAGDYNQKQINKILPLIGKINEFYNKFEVLSDEEIKSKTSQFKSRISAGENLNDILPEAFAVVKQTCKRLFGQEIVVKGQKLIWNMIPYDVQLIGGIVLHQGKIAEMKTGEGKTLVATLPAYLNALTGKGVYIVTVNDYLASRDADWMGYIYNWLNISVGNITKNTPLHMRRAEYSKDIVYVENSEFGFDYLRDNLTTSIEERSLIWRKLNYAIVDEVDSILIDEARTPLIISQPSAEPTEKYSYYCKIIELLTPCKSKKKVSKGFLQELIGDQTDEKHEIDGDYYIDEKLKTATLSSKGIQKLEEILKIENLYKDLGYEEIHHIENALRAKAVYHRDIDYLVKDGEILIVDEHTGRVMPGRRYSEGLHQAIEAKELVEIKKESQTLATITYQHYFKLFEKLSGMTGTATTEGEEFEKIYNLETLSIPTNYPVIRVDKNDSLYFDQEAKWEAVMKNIQFYHNMGEPILIGTSSIQTSELVSTILHKIRIPHYVLNAKNHELEAEIVANAGKLGSVVVATNMAGRGTDIKLEENLNEKIALNYANWIEKEISGNNFTKRLPQEIICQIFSQKEYLLFTQQLQQKFNLNSDLTITSKKKQIINENNLQIIITGYSKKNKDDLYAQLMIKRTDLEVVEQLEKYIHFGLYIFGTEKHESRRIDNQLRGRAGRQGDPGFSQFFVALDDEIMRKMGGEKIQSIAKLLIPQAELKEMELTQKQFTSSIERAQKQMEGWNFSIRKHLYDYDTVINKQRQRIYTKRDEILFNFVANQELEEYKIIEEIQQFSNSLIEKYIQTNTAFRPWNLDELVESLTQLAGVNFEILELQKFGRTDDMHEYITMKLNRYFTEKIKNYNQHHIADIMQKIYLTTIDKYWIRHIDDMHYLREQVGLYGYAQIDPIVIYKKEAFAKFQKLLYNIEQDTYSQIIKFDFSFLNNISNQIVSNINLSENNGSDKLDMVGLLKSATSNIKISKTENIKKESEKSLEIVQLRQGDKAKLLEKNDDFEILELTENPRNISTPPEIEIEIDDTDIKRKIRPNDLCSCGSGKKYKKCCGI